MTLNRMYHWVPRIISGDSQMFGSRPPATMAITAKGKSTLAGKAARNWATGWMRCDQAGRSPIHTPIGTQIRLAMAISTRTRNSVMNAQAERGQGVVQGQGLADIAEDGPGRPQGAGDHDRQPERGPATARRAGW